MRTYPLKSISVQQAKELQFRVVDCIAREFGGSEILTRGDLGVIKGQNKPIATMKAERVIANIFGVEAAALVRGAGTGALRYAFSAAVKPCSAVLVHTEAIYPTTAVTLANMGIKIVRADFNSSENLKKVLTEDNSISAALVQHTRQSSDDSYSISEVIQLIRSCRGSIPIISDDNYAVMKVDSIGAQCGADLSCFSCFKLLGPEGIGCVVGKKEYTNTINRQNYSGGCQTQGHEAIDVLRGLVYAPVALAIQAEVNDEVVSRLLSGEVKGVKKAYLANAQSKVILVELEKPIALEVLAAAEKLGAAPNPVGAESKYEIVPMFYRVSGTFMAKDSSLEYTTIRINPMRSGADTIIRILDSAIKSCN